MGALNLTEVYPVSKIPWSSNLGLIIRQVIHKSKFALRHYHSVHPHQMFLSHALLGKAFRREQLGSLVSDSGEPKAFKYV